MSASVLPGNAALQAVARDVMLRVGIPKDRWEIAAQLEVLGFRDADARERLGYSDVFAAADAIFAAFLAGGLPFVVEDDPSSGFSDSVPPPVACRCTWPGAASVNENQSSSVGAAVG